MASELRYEVGRAAVTVEGEETLVITRAFDAPARLVFAAWTDARHVALWWGPRSLGVEVVVCEARVEVGGAYRYVTRTGGVEEVFRGEYLEVAPPGRLVYTQVYEPMAHMGHAHITVTFEEAGGVTRLTARERYPSREVRDGVLASGMEEGFGEAMAQLDGVLGQLVSAG